MSATLGLCHLFVDEPLIKNANLKTIIENLLISKVKIPNLQIEQFI